MDRKNWSSERYSTYKIMILAAIKKINQVEHDYVVNKLNRYFTSRK